MKIPYGKQHITEADIHAVTEVLKADFLTTGPKVKEFEEKFASYIGSKYAVAVANGTAALHLCAMALEVDSNSKVITTPITFAASANCVRYCGGSVEFCDIDPETLVLDIEKVRQKLESAPKGTYSGIIPVDFTGYPVNLEAFRALADEYGLWIIEDACHSPGGWFTDSAGTQQNCGNGAYADLAIFSFHPVKHIACGEGGMITTNDPILYKKLLQLRTHGMIYQGDDRLIENHGRWYMELQELGYNYRIPDILCALGISQLSRADEGLVRRRAIAAKYDAVFASSAVHTHVPKSDTGHAYHLYVVEVNNRKELYDKLREEGIYAQIHYIPLHKMPYYQQHGGQGISLPYAEQYYSRCISLPMYPSLTDEEQNFVIEKVLAFAK
ncbi:MAG: UDP-4-amino-4,6-dideoxy-N-acetyl-beta-L-altrosamine transaminase [Saprospiraceae bacterium]|nr:UDP-4-amino-4,6-dideoxy-N-acetyl-beta-L-altrosamine transaminase [Saprospiraceae bacterium]